jgi:hypothetical protein
MSSRERRRAKTRNYVFRGELRAMRMYRTRRKKKTRTKRIATTTVHDALNGNNGASKWDYSPAKGTDSQIHISSTRPWKYGPLVPALGWLPVHYPFAASVLWDVSFGLE